MSLVAIDTSVAVPLLVSTHSAHRDVARWRGSQTLALSGHALAETYSVITRLPGDLRADPRDAARLLRERFAPPFVLSPERFARIADTFSDAAIAGGAVYDALVGLAAKQHDVELATRDERARATYDTLGVRVMVVT